MDPDTWTPITEEEMRDLLAEQLAACTSDRRCQRRAKFSSTGVIKTISRVLFTRGCRSNGQRWVVLSDSARAP